MQRALDDGWANPSSVHAPGRQATALLEDARRDVAAAIGAHPADVVFTSGGTEAINTAVLGLADARPVSRAVTTAIEHPAVTASVQALAGADVITLPMQEGGPPSAEALATELDRAPGHALVALQWVNHELGTVLPVPEYAAVCRERDAPLVVDASQALGKVAIDVEALGADAVAFAAHKIGGPAGAGALWLRREASVSALLRGGGQERGRRPGSPDVVACAGFGGAAHALDARMADLPRIAALRDRLDEALREAGAVVNGAAAERVATVTNTSFRGWTGAVLVAALDVEGLAVSGGAACSSGVSAGSPVLLAAHPDEPWRATSSVRWSFGPESTEDEAERALEMLSRVLSRPPG